jgi:hypothetical protein
MSNISINIVETYPASNLFSFDIAFKEGHAAKSAEERRHSNHNIRAHLGKKYITTATTKAAVSPITTNLNT